MILVILGALPSSMSRRSQVLCSAGLAVTTCHNIIRLEAQEEQFVGADRKICSLMYRFWPICRQFSVRFGAIGTDYFEFLKDSHDLAIRSRFPH